MALPPPQATGQIASANGQLQNPITTVEELPERILSMQGKRFNIPTPRGSSSAPKPVPEAKAFQIFIFRGCWECGDPKHGGYQCSHWKKILDGNGKPPPGHKGAKDKAWAKWKSDKAASKKDRINMLQVDSEDEDGDEHHGKMMIFSLVEKGATWPDAQIR